MSDLRALVLGAGGQLGRACMESVPEQVNAQGLTRSECDITDAATLKQTMGDLLPQVVINSAAYTAVDQAEEDIDVARAVNADALELAEITSAYVDEVRPTLPTSITLEQYDIQASLIESRINLLLKNGLSGLVLVLIVLFVFAHLVSFYF